MTTTAAPPAGPDPLELLGGLVLDTGRRWADTATDWQRADAAAVLDDQLTAPRPHFLTRPRGGSKTTDAVGLVPAAMITQAPDRSTSHAFARDKDQAGRLVDVIGGLVARTGLAGLVDVGTWSVTVRGSDARLVVESADAGSAFGALPWLVVVDELAAWPSTRGARALWEAVVSGLPKRADSRLLAITSAGDPTHWSAKIIGSARTSPRWRVSETPGPLPWIDVDDLAEQRRLLPDSAYARLHLNVWTAAEDRLVGVDDLAACVTLDGPLDHDPRHTYRIGLDLGLKNDRTVLSVCHAEDPQTGGRPVSTHPPKVILDRLHVLAGTRDSPVQLADVEDVAFEAATTYRAPIRLDPWQAVGLAQRLRARGITVEEWTFSPVSIGRHAMTLHLLLREHRLALPDDPALLEELANVRLRETTPGVFRLDHDSGHHDDRAVSLGLAVLALTEKAPVGIGSIAVPSGTYTRRSDQRTGIPGQRRPVTPGTRIAAAMARVTARGGPRGLPGAGGIVGVPGAWDDPQRR